MQTSVGYPYCLIRFGQEIGFKLAFMTSQIVENANPIGYIGHVANRHYSKICKDGNMTVYKTPRKFNNNEIIKDWRNLPSLNAIKKAINGHLNNQKATE